MSDCIHLTIDNITDFSKSYWTLIENKKHDLAWTGKCHDYNTCRLCSTRVGGKAFIASDINECLFGECRAVTVKVVARIGSILD